MPLVSVVMPAFNRELLISDAINSVLRQSFHDFELIVVDDGSSDRTAAVVRSFSDARIRLVQNDSNQGIPAARNHGLEEARGDYIAWLDSDDIARPRRLETQVRYLERHSSTALIGGCAGRIFQDGRRRAGIRVPPFKHEEIRCRELFTSAFQQSSLMGRAEVLKAYPYDLGFQVCEDVDVCGRISNAHRVVNLPVVLIDVRRHKGQTSRTNKQAILQAQARISGPMLDKMGVEYNAGDLARHCALARVPLSPLTADDLHRAEEWLTRLLAANAGAALFCQSALRALASQLLFDRYRRRSMKDLAGALLRSPFTADLLSRRSGSWLMTALSVVARGHRS